MKVRILALYRLPYYLFCDRISLESLLTLRLYMSCCSACFVSDCNDHTIAWLAEHNVRGYFVGFQARVARSEHYIFVLRSRNHLFFSSQSCRGFINPNALAYEDEMWKSNSRTEDAYRSFILLVSNGFRAACVNAKNLYCTHSIILAFPAYLPRDNSTILGLSKT